MRGVGRKLGGEVGEEVGGWERTKGVGEEIGGWGEDEEGTGRGGEGEYGGCRVVGEGGYVGRMG